MRYSNGKWEARIHLPPGRHSYYFFAIEKDEMLRGAAINLGSTIDVLPGEVLPAITIPQS